MTNEWLYVRCKGTPTQPIACAVLALHKDRRLFRILAGDQWLHQCWRQGHLLYVQFTQERLCPAQIAVFPTATYGMGRLAWLPKV